jgi:DNA-binding Lrp family transcriptional regulator
MEQEEIKILKILEALEEDPSQSQRELSRKLKVSLGLVNAFTKRLTKKGYFKITTLPRNRINYLLTPKGIAEKTRLTYQYIVFSIQYYKNTREKLKAIFEKLYDQNKKRIYFLGVSELTEIAYITLQETDLILAGIIDNELAGNEFMGILIEDPSALNEFSFKDKILITKLDDLKISELLVINRIKSEDVIDLRT